MDKALAKELVDGTRLSKAKHPYVDHHGSLEDVKDKCHKLRAKLVYDLKPHTSSGFTMEKLAEVEADMDMGSLRRLQPFITNDLEAKKHELAEQKKRMEEKKQDLAAIKAKKAAIKSSYPM